MRIVGHTNFIIAPSIASHDQSMSSSASSASNPKRQNSSNTPAWAHSWNRRCAELLERIPVALNAFHWHPVRSTNKMAFIAARSLTRGL